MANILVAEDDKLIGHIIERKLLDDNHKVKLVTDGEKAMAALKENLFQLVISDVMMPVNSGLDVIHYLRNVLGSEIPVLIVSGLSENDNIQEALLLGANDYIGKPFALDALEEKVFHLLKKPARPTKTWAH
ncbi:MAG: response regulator transcription factor [Marinilabiliaceae bacterium]